MNISEEKERKEKKAGDLHALLYTVRII